MEGKLRAIYILPALQGNSVIASDFRKKKIKILLGLCNRRKNTAEGLIPSVAGP